MIMFVNRVQDDNTTQASCLPSFRKGLGLDRFQIVTSRPTTPTPNAIQLQTRKRPSRRVRKARDLRATRSEPTEGRGGETPNADHHMTAQEIE